MSQTTSMWGVLLGLALLTSQIAGCGKSVATLSDEQLQVQLEEAQRQWKTTGAHVSEGDVPYITDSKIQAAYKTLKALQDEHAARAKRGGNHGARYRSSGPPHLRQGKTSRIRMIQTLRIGMVVTVSMLYFARDSNSIARSQEPLQLHVRSRTVSTRPDGASQDNIVNETVDWEPRRTALIICDMWDDHWCRGAAGRVKELAGPMNKMVHRARDQGVLIVHAPSTCVDFYKHTPQRRRALAAPHAKSPIALSQAERWGTRWCWPDPQRESDLPIDDSDMGCDCHVKCQIGSPWTRQIEIIDIEEPDAISDDGQEVYNLLAQRGIDHVFIAGVHLNMCVLGRSFAIRQMATLGKRMMLVRDMTDTMYNHRMRPFVDHFSGTDLVIEHIERHWCPTITSVDFLGGTPFRFRDDTRK